MFVPVAYSIGERNHSAIFKAQIIAGRTENNQ